MLSVGFYVILEAVTEFGEDAVAAYGIGTRIEQMIMLLTVGLNISTLSITSFNFGAKQYARVRQVYLCLLYGIGMMVLGSLLLRFSAEFWIGLFSDSHEVVIQGSLSQDRGAGSSNLRNPLYGNIGLAGIEKTGIRYFSTSTDWCWGPPAFLVFD